MKSFSKEKCVMRSVYTYYMMWCATVCKDRLCHSVHEGFINKDIQGNWNIRCVWLDHCSIYKYYIIWVTVKYVLSACSKCVYVSCANVEMLSVLLLGDVCDVCCAFVSSYLTSHQLCNVSFVEIWLQVIIQQYRINQLPLTLNIVHEQVFYCFPSVDTL